MTWTVATYLAYLALSVPLTVGVATVLSRHGRVLLQDVLGDADLAGAIDKLLVVGFLLLNLGIVSLTLGSSGVADLRGLIEQLSSKLGLVLLTTGAVHLVNVWVLTSLRRRRQVAPGWAPVPQGPPPAQTWATPYPAPGR